MTTFGHVTLRVGSSHGKSPPGLVLIHRSSVNGDITFSFSHHPTTPRLYGWELLAVYHHPDKFGDRRRWDIDNFNLSLDLT